ncbi:tail associated lysin [Lactococcus virus P2]|uniref:Baseplate protein gp16 n=2 Tax=root TaxID=1 RepID=GP16_BPLP2|nr:tail associated lysin [Lactococcus virus P2]D3KFX4.1 RecName: Full=Baseplate protein gp16; AltName: Full=Gene product 16; Short=Gp16; AltName: Full=Tail-associated lysine-like protein [Lactococcus virus P2]2WZP_R Chain R, LACTOCOCCAL PHAGE P2 ORF16 [Lactococcus virus P2]6ZIG_1 Chain 1, Baseplate protein gp16 [Lactococcus virus P2]6ZIG_Y Chain Y, Baseplate protein gp16 [Lactococcus virus P2]6ZIG_Z Chain Z, Baseplate protein gp16 [Lactococcus virus P2]6ZIH_1 Chain 1, Baseplate protein gp16 [
MLEANVYDNFNPNYYNISDFSMPNGKKEKRGLPIPKARCQVINYELWETGYLYTSSATLTVSVEVGDIVQILFPEVVPIEEALGKKKKLNLDMVYLVTDVDESNKATLKNYFWAMIESLDVPNAITKTTNFAIIDYLIDPNKNNLMSYGYFFNSSIFAGKATINRKAETSSAHDVAKRIFSKVQFQPTTTIQHAPSETDPRNLLFINFASRNWNRKRITTRVDIKQSVTMDTETIVERSAYNFAVVFVKNKATDDYTDPPKMYIAKNNGDVIDYSTYHGDGTDLPDVRTAKTLFYDRDDHGNPPELSTIKVEISPSTIVTRLIFNQNELLPLYVNDLVDIWYEGKLYSGYIADRVKTEFNDRLIFVESGDKPNVI